MIELLYQTLIFSGLIIFAVLYYLKHMATHFMLVLTEIIKMNELNEYDPVKFVENLPPMMEKLGVTQYSYYFEFLDTEHHRDSEHGKNSIKKFICDQDFTVYVEVSPGKLRWERAYLGILLVETIFLLLKVDVTLNIKATTKALTEFSKINSFLSHDIKNLAQFINILEHNLGQKMDEEKKEKLFGYLKSTAPSLKMRADRILYSLADSAKDYLPDREMVNPAELAANIANVLNVEIEVERSDEMIYTEKKGMIIIFENIIKNFYDKSINEPGIKLTMNVQSDQESFFIKVKDTGTPIVNTERIFEPFYSGKKGGLGIGLYQCRNIANNMQGKLWSENSEEGPAFILQLKKH